MASSLRPHSRTFGSFLGVEDVTAGLGTHCWTAGPLMGAKVITIGSECVFEDP